LAYRDFVDECDCGIDTTLTLTCPECNGEFEEELPLDANFFFPRKAKTR
jgi:hypothetical protein